MFASRDHARAGEVATGRGAGSRMLERPAAGDGQAAGSGMRPQVTSRASRLTWVTAYAGAAVVLFLCYLRISGTVGVTSDGAAITLQAWDILHGNWLLRGWTLSDVSFYTTELPEYVLAEIFRGLDPAVVHICGAITYTLLVVLAGLLAKGGKTGKEGLIRVLIASGIMIAPQAYSGAFVLLLSPDHTGTGVPLLLIFLLLDRAPRRWWVPAVAGLLLAWALIGDPVVLTFGVAPIVVVCAVRAYRGIVQCREPAVAHWFDLALAASAVVSVGAADAAVKIIKSLGGYKLVPLNTVAAPSGSWPAHLSLTVDGVLHLYGAGFAGGPLGLPAALAAVHLVGVALAAWATALVIRRFPACDDMIAQILAVGIVVSVTAYMLSMLPAFLYDDHEIACVLPFGAVLAGRMLAERLTRARLLPALAAVACGYLVALGYGAVQPSAPPANQALARWLGAHHLTAGLGSYPEHDSITLDSHGTIMIAVTDFRLHWAARDWLFEEKASDFDPRMHYANFVVSTQQDGPIAYVRPLLVYRAFGRPAHTYRYGPWTIMIWNKNLLYEIR
jgi:hypothetical protein